jgi:hypothetical protein
MLLDVKGIPMNSPFLTFSTPIKKGGCPASISHRKGCQCPSLKKYLKKNDPQVILSTSKCFKMTPYAIKMHLESIKLQ